MSRWKVPPNEEWLVYVEGDRYIFDPWEREYYLYFRELGVFDYVQDEGKITVVPGKAASGSYTKELVRVVNEYRDNPKLLIEDIPNRPAMPKKKTKKVVKKRGPTRKTIEKELLKRKMKPNG